MKETYELYREEKSQYQEELQDMMDRKKTKDDEAALNDFIATG